MQPHRSDRHEKADRSKGMKSSLQPTPFTVIGGFLGAGKTTLLNRILDNAAGLKFAVLVNDFGAVNIDADLISAHDGETMTLSNGCICCSMASGFVDTMLRVSAQRNRFDHIVVEASGVSQPERIMDFARIDPELLPASIIVLVDAAELETRMADSATGDLVATQLQAADLVLINKVDLVSDSALQRTLDIVQAHNPQASMLRVIRADVPLALVLGEFSSETPLAVKPVAGQLTHSSDRILVDHFHTLTLLGDKPIERLAVMQLEASLNSHVVRGKGILQLAGESGLWSWQRVGNRSRIECLQQVLQGTGMTRAVVEIVLIGTQPINVAELVLSDGMACSAVGA